MDESRASLSKSFRALNASQLCGVAAEHVARWLALAALIAWDERSSAGAANVWMQWPAWMGWKVALVCALSALPFLLLSPLAGAWADQRGKRDWIVTLNLAGAGLAVFSLAALASGAAWLLYLSVLLWAARAALFEPVKLAILPELVSERRLAVANGHLSALTCLGMALGWWAAMHGLDRALSGVAWWKLAWPCPVLAVAGLAASYGIDDTAAAARDKACSADLAGALIRNLRALRADRPLWLCCLSLGAVMFIAGFVSANVVDFARESLGITERRRWMLTPVLALMPVLGAMAGAWMAARVSRRGIEVGLVPFGALAVSLVPLLLALPFENRLGAAALLAALGAGGGLILVTLRAFLQRETPRRDRGELIAASVWISEAGLVLGWVAPALLAAAGIGSPSARFALLGLATLGLSVWAVRQLPDFLIRFLGLLVARVSYRLHVVGEENLPERGGALLVCNHVSYVDVVLLLAAQPRRIRFLIDRAIYDRPLFNRLLRLMGAIRIAYDEGPESLRRSYEQARRAIDEGLLAGLFAEGSLTRTGYTMEFKQGFEQIVRGSTHPILPVNIHGLWGSIFSYAEWRVMGRLWRWIFGRRVIVSYGRPMPPDSSAFAVRQAVMELESEAFEHERPYHLPLPLEFAQVARARWRRYCMADTTGRDLTFGQALTGAIALSKVLRADLKGQPRVGVLAPPSVGGALVNVAISLLGKTPVNLNYTASREAIELAIRQSGLETILAPRKFVEKLGFGWLPGLACLEDLAPRLTAGVKIAAWLKALGCPLRFLMTSEDAQGRTRYGGSADSEAAIIFSSGSTGNPKGVILSHYNLYSNCAGALQVFRLRPDDVICGILPFFHSFGFMVTIWLPLVSGVGVAYHVNPVEAERIGKLVRQRRCTFLATTPTFLYAYTRKVPLEDFASLRIVITGAEKLKERIAAAWEKKFGFAPLEGYGCTELSPVVSVNMRDVEMGGVAQVARRPGTIGRPIPGVTVRVVDPENLDRERGHGEEGLLLVKGPNVMQGYLNQPEKTAEVIRNGWYVTGDVARIDHDGFITITDRLSRFSKIGGEMVPHLAIEEALQSALGAEAQVCAVTALPDEDKGEKLIVLLTPEAGDPAEAHRRLREAGLPNLWVPPARHFLVVDALPLLGSGKLDLKGLKALAAEKMPPRAA